jgi:hypothetical protein
MPLRLFGGGNTRVRACPACERKIKADATFCPSCYMVFRPEGAAALREYLQGARVPADVYLLRKMQSEDPNTGPVTRAAPAGSAPAVEATPPPTSEPLPAPMPDVVPETALPASEPLPASPFLLVEPTSPSTPIRATRGSARGRNGVEGLLLFEEPLPPAGGIDADLGGILTWMLEHDPLIPNNLTRLAAIHAAVHDGTPAGRLRYEEHILLQVTDDLRIHPAKEGLGMHLGQLALAYRHSAEAYRKAEGGGEGVMNSALWQMASVASRLRIEAWIYRSRYGDTPQISSVRQRELPLRFAEN